jgi:hypothetical protein
VTAKAVVRRLLEDDPESPPVDPKDFIDRYHAETQPEFYFQRLKGEFDSMFERMDRSGVLQVVMNKYDADVLAQAIMQLAIEKAGLYKTRRAYLDLKRRAGHSVLF